MTRPVTTSSASVRNSVLVGIGLLMVVDALDAIKEVVAGRLVVRVQDLTLTFWLFMIAIAVFQLVHHADRRSDRVAMDRLARRDLILLNVSTAAGWIGFFRALRSIEPAIVSALVGAMGPVLVWVFNRMLRPTAPKHWIDDVTALGIGGAGVVLVVASFSGVSAVGGEVSRWALADGFVSTIVCGVGITTTTILLKRLSDRRVGTRQVMAHRFYLLLTLTGVGAFLNDRPFDVLASEAPLIVFIALSGVVATLYLLQEGIRRCEPMTVEAMLAVAPLFTLIVQLFDHRLELALASWGGVLAVCGFAFANAYYHLKETDRWTVNRTAER